tara:strand:- start:1199 stop:2308 length:1110 start_codon:yes stop_codon:yes gene_type:complete
MSEFNTEDITDRAGTGKPDLTNGFNINGSDSGISPHKHTESANEPSSPSNGDAWLDTTNDVYKVYINNEWKEWFGTTTTYQWWGARGMNVGGHSATDSMDYIDLSVTSGNATDFGNLTVSRQRLSASGDGVRGLALGGLSQNVIDYWAFATTGNAVDFGDLLSGSNNYGATVSDATKAIYAGGTSGTNNVIQYVTVQTAGNAADFGDLSLGRYFLSATNNLTLGLFMGGYTTQYVNRIDKITMSTLGNATDVGDMSDGNSGGGQGVCSDNTTGLVMGGNRTSDAWNPNIEKVTIATAGNGSDFGDLTQDVSYAAQTANATNARGVCMGGYAPSAQYNNIEYVTISSPGNATDFGDLSAIIQYSAGVSGA